MLFKSAGYGILLLISVGEDTDRGYEIPFAVVGVRADGHAAEQSPTTYSDSKFKYQNVVVQGSLVGDNTDMGVCRL